jgi:hypothetical protein
MNNQGYHTGLTIQKQAARVARYANIDGSAELGWATALVCWSVTTYGTIILRPKSLWLHAILWLFFLCGALAPLLLPRAIKRFVTWPRTGYVACLRDRKFWIAITVSFVIAGSLGIFIPMLLKPEMQQFIREELQKTSPSVLPGPAPAPTTHWGKATLILFLVSNPLMYLMINALSLKQHSWKWLLLMVMTAGSVAISFLIRGNFFELMRPLMLFIGLTWFISGAATLYSYLRNTPTASEAS